MVVLPCIVGCGGAALGDGPKKVLTAPEAKQLLLQLPYEYTFRPVALPKGATGALAGRAVGTHRTVVHFGVALGKEPEAVPVPHAGIAGAYGYPLGGFVFTEDLLVRHRHHKWVEGKQFHTGAQWKEANKMVVAMEEKLCRATTGEACHE